RLLQVLHLNHELGGAARGISEQRVQAFANLSFERRRVEADRLPGHDEAARIRRCRFQRLPGEEYETQLGDGEQQTEEGCGHEAELDGSNTVLVAHQAAKWRVAQEAFRSARDLDLAMPEHGREAPDCSGVNAADPINSLADDRLRTIAAIATKRGTAVR